MNNEVQENYALLSALIRQKDLPLIPVYRQFRGLLEHLCRTQIPEGNLQFTDLSARISFVSSKINLSVPEQNRLHTVRLTSNVLLNGEGNFSSEVVLRDAKTLAFFIKKLSGEEIPDELYHLLPRADATYLVNPPTSERVKQMRVCFQYSDEQYLYVRPSETISDDFLKVRYNIPQINEEFSETCKILWKHAQLNLLDVSIDRNGILTPSFIILEPDYLIDISSLAECFREYGHHPANYLLARFQSPDNTRPLLLGNIANLFLDEWIHSKTEPDYMACMKKAFRTYPIELAACPDLLDRQKEKEFFDDCKRHFEHIRATVQDTFSTPGYDLDKANAVLEPSYICEALGLQGRLDYMQQDMSAFIEMKSGKADEYSIQGKVEPKENNRVQMLLYQAVLEYSMGMDHRKVRAYLLYTRYPLLYPARSSWAMVRRVMDVRNRIVATEYSIQLRNAISYTAERLEELDPEVLNERQLDNILWKRYLYPSIYKVKERIEALSSLERSYFYSLYNFITKELYTSKTGDVDREGCTGASSLWLATLDEKLDAGEIIYDLRIKESHATKTHKPFITLTRISQNAVAEKTLNLQLQTEIQSTQDQDRATVRLKPKYSSAIEEPVTLPNFREGDAIVLYERNKSTDNVTNRMVFKGNIERMDNDDIRVRLRASQQNIAVLPENSYYAIEHDYMDTAFRGMYNGLANFLSANKDRRDLLLAQREPQFDRELDPKIESATNDFERVILKARAAKDFFLLVGPPGTGKTSHALRGMVEAFHCEEKQLLLLSYTNRAVDEICKALVGITPELDFIRIGNELSCEPAYRKYLIENVLDLCSTRREVQKRIQKCTVFVGTVATLSSKTEIFRLKTFDVAIIDEATQILEPQLLGLLCHRTDAGKNAIGKFILIGDYKQLPAVVLQSDEQCEIYDNSLREAGLVNLKNSLFERLYKTVSSNAHACDMLCKQGRMHPVIASFPNKAFYGGRLKSVGLPHQQQSSIPTLASSGQDVFEERLLHRVSFIPSVPESFICSPKVNHSEAIIVAHLAKAVYQQYAKDGMADDEEQKCIENGFNPSVLGIIAPYRSQIALIRKEIAALEIPALNEVLIDTVERFQGSERDVIIYSFCVNRLYQLKYLSNITEENGVLIDRKLNVALTRARKQMFITGVPELMKRDPIYSKLLTHISEIDTDFSNS